MMSAPPSAGRDGRRDERGAVAVEFAFILPILLLLVFGIIDFGYMINRDTMINNVSRDAVRVGSLNGSYAQVLGTVTSELSQYGIPTSSPTTVVTICAKSDDGTACSVQQTQAAYDAVVASSSTTRIVTVKIVYTHKWITPTMSALLGPSTVLTKQSTMRIE